MNHAFYFLFSLAVNSFEQSAGQLAMDLIGDDEKHIQRQQSMKKWDARRKKMVGAKVTLVYIINLCNVYKNMTDIYIKGTSSKNSYRSRSVDSSNLQEWALCSVERKIQS
jgi:hypothetical protein